MSDERRVWIAQCLCPQHHCILATAGEADSARLAEEAVAAPLRESVAQLLRSGTLNPWCGLCHCPVDTWTYDLGRTGLPFDGGSHPALEQNEREQAIANALWGDLPRSD
jgi:hypothetical protein